MDLKLNKKKKPPDITNEYKRFTLTDRTIFKYVLLTFTRELYTIIKTKNRNYLKKKKYNIILYDIPERTALELQNVHKKYVRNFIKILTFNVNRRKHQVWRTNTKKKKRKYQNYVRDLIVGVRCNICFQCFFN